MHASQPLGSHGFAIPQGAMRRLYREGTGSIIVEDQSDPYQGVPRLWTLLKSATSDLREGHSATTGECIVITKNQIDPPESSAAMGFNFQAALPPVAVSPASVLEGVRAVFGLNISETAAVFGIARQTAYQWMKLANMEQVRSHKDRARIRQLYGAAQSWRNHPPLKGRWLHALLPSGNTVLDLLKAPRLNLDALRLAYSALAASTADRRREEGERATQAVAALAGAFEGLGAGRKARRRRAESA